MITVLNSQTKLMVLSLSSSAKSQRKMAMMRRSTSCCFLIIILSYFVDYIGFFCIPVSLAEDTILVGQVVRVGELRASSNDLFRLQFSDTGESVLYFGIKYTPLDKFVWVANPDTPIQDESVEFKITQYGKMVLSNDKRDLFIIKDQAEYPATVANYNTPNATLLDTGNLVFRVGDHIVWQSFDYPFDTWLPGMKLGLFRSTSLRAAEEHRFLNSSHPDVSGGRGAFTLGVDPNNLKELVIWERGVVYWRSGLWNSHNFTHFPFPNETYLLKYITSYLRGYLSSKINFSYFSNESQSYFTYTTRIPLMFKLYSDGNLNITRPFNFNITRPFNRHFNRNITLSFDRKHPIEITNCHDDSLSLRNKGCANPEITACGTGRHVFNLTTGIMEFRDYLDDDTLGIGDCKFLCTQKCSCNGYASRHDDGKGCIFYRGTLFSEQEGVQDAPFYLRNGTVKETVPGNPTINKRRKWWLWLTIAVAVASVLILTPLSLFCYLKRNRCGKGNNGESKDGMSQGTQSLMHELKNEVEIFDDKHNHRKNDLELPFFHFSSIRIATDDFSNANKIGQGGFGPVYKGKLGNGQEIAVKRLLKDSQQGLKEFKNEVILISKLQHRNLVRLLGCCIQEDERILIYEYMPNKSLDSFVFDVKKRALLDWKMRVCIIEGIAQGLLYLHKYSRLRIIHRDLKTSNILLDNSMNPKISDFGTARIFGDSESQANTNRIVGTYGYMSPEYALDGLFSVKSDIFSFGIMILEIISGKKNTGFYQPNRPLNLLGYAWDLWNEGRGLEIMDDVLAETYSASEILRYIQVGLLCVQESPEARPTISEVLSMLNNEMIAILAPKQPAFSTIVSSYHASTSEISKSSSLIDITITEVGGR